MEKRSKGTSTRYDDDLGGNHIQRVKDMENAGKNNYYTQYKQRYCESCRRYVEKTKERVYKGWKCEQCRLKEEQSK